MHPFLRKMNSYICQKHGRTNVLLQAKYGIGIVYNYVRYSATISDYFEGSFYTKTHEEKLEYITSPQALQFAVFVDSMDYVRKYTSKTEMYQALKDYIHRDQLFTVMGNTKTVLCDKNQEEVHNCTISSVCSREQFMSFVKKHPMCIYKPDGNDCGRGIELWTVNETNAEEKYQKAISEPAVLDELVVQAPVMSALNPSSVNTVRLFSLVIDGKCDFFAAFFRMGRNGSIVDNLAVEDCRQVLM